MGEGREMKGEFANLFANSQQDQVLQLLHLLPLVQHYHHLQLVRVGLVVQDILDHPVKPDIQVKQIIYTHKLFSMHNEHKPAVLVVLQVQMVLDLQGDLFGQVVH